MIRHQMYRLVINSSSLSVTKLHSMMPMRSITINWKLRDGSIVKTEGKVGENLMRLAHQFEIDLEGEF